MSEESIQNDLILITNIAYLIHIALYLQYKSINISESILMLEVSFQQLGKCKCICVLHG